MMRFRTAMIALGATLLWGCLPDAGTPAGTPSSPPQASGGRFVEKTYHNPAFGEDAVRRVTIWLPPGYDDTDEHYGVIYAHDGQNLFEPGRSFSGDEWEMDETLTRLIASGDVPPAIVVGIWHGDHRWADYVPQTVAEALPEPLRTSVLGPYAGRLYADGYLRFLVDTLKPDIDGAFRTKTGADDTVLIGASMGGLISLYALGEYPEVFGGAAMLSIHWPLGEPDHPDAHQAIQATRDWIDQSGLDPTVQRLWFDRGSEGLDAHYQPYADAIEAHFEAKGWTAAFQDYPGTDHNEEAWAARLHEPLVFLLSARAAEREAEREAERATDGAAETD